MLTEALILFACATFEAQVISQVKEVIPGTSNAKSCEIILNIDLSDRKQSFIPSGNCPLSVDEVVGRRVKVDNCSSLEAGDMISGYLVADGKIIVLE